MRPGNLSLSNHREMILDNASDLPWAPHSPGDFIRADILGAHGISQGKLAEMLGVSRRTINQLVVDRRGVSTEMAIQLSQLTGQSPEYWLKLQMQYDLWKVRQSKDHYDIRPLASIE